MLPSWPLPLEGCGNFFGSKRTLTVDQGTDLLNRANADPISLTESAINGARLGHPHLGAVNEKRNV